VRALWVIAVPGYSAATTETVVGIGLTGTSSGAMRVTCRRYSGTSSGMRRRTAVSLLSLTARRSSASFCLCAMCHGEEEGIARKAAHESLEEPFGADALDPFPCEPLDSGPLPLEHGQVQRGRSRLA
jgi:hypothetical protein